MAQTALTLRSRVREAGIQIAVGLGPYKPSCIRIGHMGDIRMEDVDRTMDAVEEAMSDLMPPRTLAEKILSAHAQGGARPGGGARAEGGPLGGKLGRRRAPVTAKPGPEIWSFVRPT